MSISKSAVKVILQKFWTRTHTRTHTRAHNSTRYLQPTIFSKNR